MFLICCASDSSPAYARLPWTVQSVFRFPIRISNVALGEARGNLNRQSALTSWAPCSKPPSKKHRQASARNERLSCMSSACTQGAYRARFPARNQRFAARNRRIFWREKGALPSAQGLSATNCKFFDERQTTSLDISRHAYAACEVFACWTCLFGLWFSCFDLLLVSQHVRSIKQHDFVDGCFSHELVDSCFCLFFKNEHSLHFNRFQKKLETRRFTGQQQ